MSQIDKERLKNAGIGKETTPGTPSLSPLLPRLWEPLMLDALKTPDWLRDMPSTPPPPLTFRQKMLLQWYRLLARWPLEWKDRSEEKWD